MEESLYIEWVQKFFKGLAVGTTTQLDGLTGPQSYLHRTELRETFSVTGKWESTSFEGSQVMADVVAMDSELPMKVWGAMATASGDIPKIGMHLQLNENQLTTIDTMVAVGQGDAAVEQFFNHTPYVIRGVYERLEKMYHEGLSTGYTVVEDDENVGTGVRLNFKYLDANKFGVDTLWSDVNSKPFDDIQRVLDKAEKDGKIITRVRLDRATFDNISRTTQAKELFAFQSNFVGSNIPTPDKDQMNGFVNRRYGFTFEIMNRTCTYQKNGNNTTVRPWAPGNVVFLTSAPVGLLVYARLAEQNRKPGNKATYTQPTPYILVSKYHKIEPSFSEHTKSQARVFPVINNVNSIYLLESSVIEA